MGEILSFADRNFYNDWWNSDDIVVFLENLEPSSASLGSPTSVQTFAQQWSICQECLIRGIFHLGGVTRIFGLCSTQNVQVLRFCWNALSGNIFLLDLTQLTQFDSFYFSLTHFISV